MIYSSTAVDSISVPPLLVCPPTAFAQRVILCKYYIFCASIHTFRNSSFSPLVNMELPQAGNVDARKATFYDVRRDQYNLFFSQFSCSQVQTIAARITANRPARCARSSRRLHNWSKCTVWNPATFDRRPSQDCACTVRNVFMTKT